MFPFALFTSLILLKSLLFLGEIAFLENKSECLVYEEFKENY